MKKPALLMVLAVLIAIPVLFWARTLTWGAPWAVYLHSTSRFLALVGFVLAVAFVVAMLGRKSRVVIVTASVLMALLISGGIIREEQLDRVVMFVTRGQEMEKLKGFLDKTDET